MRHVMAALIVATGLWAMPGHAASTQPSEKPPAPTAEENFQRRWPQPARVGDLIGLAVLDEYDATIGHVRHVVRTPEGKIQLIVTHGGWFGYGGRLVAVPLEVVGMLGRQIAALEFFRDDFAKAPTWTAGQSTAFGHDEVIRVALTKR
jgi:hypothetical protein